jgi:hypothetical protein
LLIPILFAFGCANHLNLIPEGYQKLVDEHPQLAKVAARVDYPIVVATEPEAKHIPIVFAKNGHVIWSKPFWNKVTEYRFALIAEGVDNALCYTEDWTTVGSDDFTKIQCAIDAQKYLAQPLVAMLEYRFDGDKESYLVERLYYMVLKK